VEISLYVLASQQRPFSNFFFITPRDQKMRLPFFFLQHLCSPGKIRKFPILKHHFSGDTEAFSKEQPGNKIGSGGFS